MPGLISWSMIYADEIEFESKMAVICTCGSSQAGVGGIPCQEPTQSSPQPNVQKGNHRDKC